MPTYLLDVNVLLALHDRFHVHHQSARSWFEQKGRNAWASCPITEIGFVRIASQPTYPNPMGGVQAALARVRRLRDIPGHEFWVDDLTIGELVDPSVPITHSHVTDVYLLALAAQHGGKLATLDGRIPVHAVQGGREAIEVLTP